MYRDLPRVTTYSDFCHIPQKLHKEALQTMLWSKAILSPENLLQLHIQRRRLLATTASTALQALVNIGRIKPGQKILVNGASGGVGSYAVQLCKRYETELWGTCSGRNLDYLKSIGADHALDYQRTSLIDLTEKFDIILDAAANSSYGECTGILAPKGVYITLLPSLRLFTGKIRSIFSARKCALCVVQPKTADLAKIARLIDEKAIATSVAYTYPIAELEKALEKFMVGGLRGKIGVVIEE